MESLFRVLEPVIGKINERSLHSQDSIVQQVFDSELTPIALEGPSQLTEH
jgi:hypothetical protein